MPFIDFPDVPNVPGVPALARSFTVPSVSSLFVGGLAGLAAALFGVQVWGIFNPDGSAAMVFESFLGIRYRNGSRISNYPVEQGGFASYNKVASPFDASVRIAYAGDQAARKGLLNVCETMVKSTDLFSIVTPEVTYPSANLVNYSYERVENGPVSMLVIELDFQEVRQTAAAQFSPAQPSGADPASNGQVQAIPLSGDYVHQIDTAKYGEIQ